MYDFDTPALRAGSGSIKWDMRESLYHNADALPFWVADSDYRSAPEIVDALKDAVDRCVFGYVEPGKRYFDAVRGWLRDRHGWETEEKWILPSTGIVSECANVIRCFTKPGDRIVIQTPVYDPFKKCIESAGRTAVENRLTGENVSGWHMDFNDLDCKLRGARLMILCSPHNPVGRVWTAEEVGTVAAMCKQHGVLLVSDEIHWDILIDGSVHFTAGLTGTPDNVIVMTSSGKTFNLAGLKNSNIIIPDDTLREKLKQFHSEHHIESPNNLGLIACQAAYEKGARWCDEQNQYLTENYHFAREFLRSELPQVTIAKLQGTYLMWLDMRYTGAGSHELTDQLAKAGACLNDGVRYGGESDGFMRLNIACPRSQLEKGLESICKGVQSLRHNP